MTPEEATQLIEVQLSHVWMVRTFLKHSDEAEDEDIQEVFRTLYDYCMATGAKLQAGDHAAYLKQAKKKFAKLRKACGLYLDVQEEVSTHTNFQMAGTSLKAAVARIGEVLEAAG